MNEQQVALPKPYWTSPDGRHVIYCADCLTVLPHLSGVDAVVTDPFYGVGGAVNGMRKQMGHKSSTDYQSPFVDSPEEVSRVAVTAVRMMAQVAPVAVTPGFKCMNLYDRPDHIGGYYYQGQSSVTPWGAAWWQPIFFYGKDPKVGKLQRDMFLGKSNQDKCEHPCPKELETWTLLVERMSFCGETILDPFMGSGTTGVACIRTGRRFIGIEIEPKYCQIAVERMERELAQPCLPTMEPEKVKQAELL